MLDEQAMRHASQEMMKTFQAKMTLPLYQPYWMASIYRNTDNVHIFNLQLLKQEISDQLLSVKISLEILLNILRGVDPKK